jgi:hypothetical protein
VAIVLAGGACNDVGAGHLYLALNESDNDIIVDATTDTHAVVRVPAHTRGALSVGWSGPTETWKLIVRDAQCAPVASFPLKNQPTKLTLHVTANTEVELADESTYSSAGQHVVLSNPLPDAKCP